uniref:Kinase n=1 Tax=Enterobius vermicularis TaxID=51028 RepID=A0A0N4UV39_ENTVE
LTLDLTEADDPYYQYLLAYYQSYERYLGRLHQLYPNLTLPQVQQRYNPNLQLPYSKQIKDGVIVLQSYEYFCTVRSDLCNLLFSCPPCSTKNEKSDEDDVADEVSVITTPNSSASETTTATNTISGIHGAHIEGAETTKQQSHRQPEPDDIYDELQIEPLTSGKEDSKRKTDQKTQTNSNITSERTIIQLRNSEVKGSIDENPSYPEYYDEEIVEDDTNADDLISSERAKNYTNHNVRRRSKRQTYQKYPVHSQQYCTCPAPAELENSLKTQEELLQPDFSNSEKARAPDVPEEFLRAAKGCSLLEQDRSGSSATGNCSWFQNGSSFKSPSFMPLRSEPLSRRDFENCLRLNISEEDCLRTRQSFLVNRVTTSPKQIAFPETRLIVENNFSDFTETFIEDSTKEASRSNLLTHVSAPVKDRHFEAGVDKWLRVSHFKSDDLHNGVTKTGLGRRQNVLVNFKNWTADYKSSVRPEFLGPVQNNFFAEDDGFVNGVPEVEKTQMKSKKGNKEFLCNRLTSGFATVPEEINTKNTAEQSLVSLIDPDSGDMPRIDPPTAAMSDLESVENQNAEVAAVETLNRSPHRTRISGSNRTVSRLGIIKTKPNGTVFTYLHLDSPMNVLQKAVFISRMEYGGCLLSRDENCRKSIINAYLLASSLLEQEESDRKKVLYVVTSRTRKQIRSLYFDIHEVVQHAIDSGVVVHAVFLGTQYSRQFEIIICESLSEDQHQWQLLSLTDLSLGNK